MNLTRCDSNVEAEQSVTSNLQSSKPRQKAGSKFGGCQGVDVSKEKNGKKWYQLSKKIRDEKKRKPKFYPVTCSCLFCGKLGACRSKLEVHMRVHTKVKPFECPKCDVSFKTKGVQILHYQQVHGSDRNFECVTCGKRFKNKQFIATFQDPFIVV